METFLFWAVSDSVLFGNSWQRDHKMALAICSIKLFTENVNVFDIIIKYKEDYSKNKDKLILQKVVHRVE